ncbi:LAMI_0E13542g1_1 [Lachancea mirantina]|uniref:Needs CLA4 to survive protein 3 n=1 Tax=Lachancea mirantina TaxID=1230905 RepID=A0A1G4JQY8_9SACH|nr:LAMI_0E13542g1_1 [Lachancea mirantina]
MNLEDRKELEALRKENAELKRKLGVQKFQNDELAMSLEEFKRYGRQMIVETFGGVDGQLKLRNAKVLIIGAGGLGCPCLPYLAGAGIGHIGIVDNDVVDTSNLHRQVLHSSNSVGKLKCDSAKEFLQKLNPHVEVTTYPVRLSHANCFGIFTGYDYVLDCTDTPLTRYLISDVAVCLGMTVVSASGLGYEGQLSILNFKSMGPCYRCFYPAPPSPSNVSSCQEGGVIGPCIGLVGIMMAVETIKLIMGVYTEENFEPFLLQYSGFPHQTLRRFKMRGRKPNCISCGPDSTVNRAAILAGGINYELFCGKRNYDVCKPEERITVEEFEKAYMSQEGLDYTLLDVRPHHHYDISHLPNTFNITVKELRDMDGNMDLLKRHIPKLTDRSEVLVMCRYGNDSQLATKLLKDEFKISTVRDIRGGLFKYIDEINPSLPKY